MQSAESTLSNGSASVELENLPLAFAFLATRNRLRGSSYAKSAACELILGGCHSMPCDGLAARTRGCA